MNVYDFTSHHITSHHITSHHIINHFPKRKALIVTLFDPIGNYGNSLQHYALQETLKHLDFDSDSLECELIELGKLRYVSNFLKKNLKRAVKFVLAILGVKKYREKLMHKIKVDPEQKAVNERIKKNCILRKKFFDSFYSESISSLIPCIYREALRSKASQWKDYDYVIVGSDQVWNIKIIRTYEALRFYYLMFIEKDKRVNYAPSFGVSKLTHWEKKIHIKGLNGFNMLSCREDAGCRLIRELTGRDAEHVLDPTLLLTAEEWRAFERKPSYELPEHYALAYFFGGMKNYADTLEKIAGDLPVIDAIDSMSDEFCMTGPREFVYLIDHADCVFTSSFHGTAFSVNFGKKFVSFGRFTTTFSRIESLLSRLGLTSRIYEPEREAYDEAVDYDDVQTKLAAWRESSIYRKQLENQRSNKPREKRFQLFPDAHTGKKFFMTYKEALSEPKSRWQEYDYAVTGSDQVWHNWSHTQEELEFYYLEFMPEEKRINYATSFGFSKFSKSDYEYHKKGLQGFRKVIMPQRINEAPHKADCRTRIRISFRPYIIIQPQSMEKIRIKTRI